MDFYEHLLAHYPQELVDGLFSSLHEESKHACLLNTHKMEEEKFLSLFPSLQKHPIVPHAFLYDKETLPLGKNIFHDAGLYYLQEPSAMCVAHFLPVEEGDHILDLCAAPGGKTVQLALRYPSSVIVSNDLSFSRAAVLSSNVERFGFSHVVVTSMDALQFPTHFKEHFHHVVVDAPCSGSGMFRKDEDVKKDWTYEKVLACAQRQKEILHAASQCLAPGGYLLYSTCSFSYEEDEEVILDFLRHHEDYTLVPIQHESFYEHPDCRGTAHLFPHLFPGEGHFLALLKKKGEKPVRNEKKIEPASAIKRLLQNYPISLEYTLQKENRWYSYPYPFSFQGIRVLRYGLELGEQKKDLFIPSYALSHALNWKRDIPLTLEEIKLYLHGDVLPNRKEKDGYYTVSYLGISLGFVRIVQGTAKNLYPKGLRKNPNQLLISSL